MILDRYCLSSPQILLPTGVFRFKFPADHLKILEKLTTLCLNEGH